MMFTTVVVPAAATISQTHQTIPRAGGAGVSVDSGAGVGAGVDTGPVPVYFSEPMGLSWGRSPLTSIHTNAILTLASIILPIIL